MLEFFGEEGRWSRGHRFDSLQHALDAAAALAAIEPEDWRAVDEPFGTAPPISADLLSQLMSVPASIDGRFEHRPTQVRLRDGVWRDGVYLEELQTYIDLWGLPPGHDRRQCEVEFTDIVEVRESSRRLPVHIANALYEAGESAMGGCCFTLVTNSGLRIPCRTGNFVDFIDLPTGVTSADIARVEPHAVDARTAREAADTPDIMWSVYKLAD